MTEQQASDAIHHWVVYSKFGAVDEPDHGDGAPAGYKAIGLESQYRSPQIWDAPDPKASPDDIRAAYQAVEGVFKRMAKQDQLHVTLWYFGQRDPIHHKDAQQRFRAGVMRL